MSKTQDTKNIGIGLARLGALLSGAGVASIWDALAPALDAVVAQHAAETIDARIARLGIVDVSESRLESLSMAHVAGVDDATLRTLADAARLKRDRWIVLPSGRYEKLSRGKGWARLGRGKDASWAERTEEGGYKVARAGEWTVGSDDGFQRKDQVEWKVRHVTVGDAVWTIAD